LQASFIGSYVPSPPRAEVVLFVYRKYWYMQRSLRLFQVKDTLSSEEQVKGMRLVLSDGVTSQVLATLTTGAFLAAFALELGASNLVIGLLAAIPPLTQVLQVPTVYLVERVGNRRAVTVIASFISRLAWIAVIAIPFVFSVRIGLWVLLGTLIFHTAVGAVSACSWLSWMRDLLPIERLGDFFSRRMALMVAVNIALSIIASLFIDYWQSNEADQMLVGYSVLFATAMIAGLIGVYLLARTPEPTMTHSAQDDFWHQIVEPFKDLNFRNLVSFLGAWNFAINLATPFFTVYMLDQLEMNLSLVIVLGTLSQLVHLMCLRMWGKFIDKFSNKTVLKVTAPMYLICIFAWTFTTMPEPHILTLPLLIVIHVILGIATAGTTLATGNIGLKLAPQGSALSYLSAVSLVNSLAAGIAPILGGQFADFFTLRNLSLSVAYDSPNIDFAVRALDIQGWDFFFIFAFLLGFVALQRLVVVNEEGDVDENLLLEEIGKETRYQMILLPQRVRIHTEVAMYRVLQYIFSGLLHMVPLRGKQRQR